MRDVGAEPAPRTPRREGQFEKEFRDSLRKIAIVAALVLWREHSVD
jgi:hypothetical protein